MSDIPDVFLTIRHSTVRAVSKMLRAANGDDGCFWLC